MTNFITDYLINSKGLHIMYVGLTFYEQSSIRRYDSKRTFYNVILKNDHTMIRSSPGYLGFVCMAAVFVALQLQGDLRTVQNDYERQIGMVRHYPINQSDPRSVSAAIFTVSRQCSCNNCSQQAPHC